MLPPIRFRGFIAPLILAVLALAASRADAGTTRWGVAGFGSYSTYAMSDVNDQITIVNIVLGFADLPPMDQVSDGVGFGGGVRAVLGDRVMIMVDYERLTGSTSYSAGGVSLEYDLPCDAFLATGVYRFPGSGKVRLGLGGGLGYYSSAASIDLSAADIGLTAKGDLDGHAVGLHAVGMADAALSPAVHVEALAGYRYSSTGSVSVEAAGEALALGYNLDWSGLMTRVGIAVYFGAGK